MVTATTLNKGRMAVSTYALRLAPDKKFSPHAAKECLRSVLANEFEDKNYDKDAVPGWTRETSEKICGKLQELGFERYKFVVQVVIGEQRGAGTRMACRCIWDSDTDVYASEFFSNVSK